MDMLYLRVEEIYKRDCNKVENGKDNVALVANIGDHRRCDFDNQECPEPLRYHCNGITT